MGFCASAPVFHGPSVLYGRWPACPNQRRHASPPTLLPPPLHPNASGDSKQSRQIIEGGAADKPAGDARAQGKAELVCPAAAAAPPLKLAHHQSKSCSGRAGGAVHSGGRVSPRLCFRALCFLCFPAGLLSSHEHLLGCALDSNHKKTMNEGPKVILTALVQEKAGKQTTDKSL